MKNALLASIAKSINAYLKLDPTSKERFAALDGKTITIELLPFYFKCQLVFEPDGMLMTEDNTRPYDAKVSGTPLQLLGVALAKENRHRFFAEDVHIEGDASVGEQMIALFDEVEIDWEEKLSHVLGDVPTHHLGNFVRYLKKIANDSESTLMQNINEYVHEEKAIFPANYALEDFYQEVDTINMDVERLAARINVLKHKLSHEDTK